MTELAQIPEEDIHAFIDGELDTARAREIAARIAADPALAETVAAFQADKALIAAHYGPLLDRPLPRRMADTIARGRLPLRLNFTRLAMAASVLVALVTGFALYVLPPKDGAVDAAVAAHEGQVTGSNVAADAAGISGVLGLKLKLPDLAKAGYTLAGVTAVPAARGRAVKIAYHNAAGELFTLYLEKSPGNAQFEITRRGDVLVCLWQDDVLATVMVGRMPAAEMLRVASLAYNGLYF